MDKWNAILKDPSFKKQPKEVQEEVARNFFNTEIAPNKEFSAQHSDIQAEVRRGFFKTIGSKDIIGVTQEEEKQNIQALTKPEVSQPKGIDREVTDPERLRNVKRLARTQGLNMEQAEEAYKSGVAIPTVSPPEVGLMVAGGGAIPALARGAAGKLAVGEVAKQVGRSAIAGGIAAAGEPAYQVAGEEVADKYGPTAGLLTEVALGVGSGMTLERKLEQAILNKRTASQLSKQIEKSFVKGKPKAVTLSTKYADTAQKAEEANNAILIEKAKKKVVTARKAGKSPELTPDEHIALTKVESKALPEVQQMQQRMRSDGTTMSPQKLINDVTVEDVAKLAAKGETERIATHMQHLAPDVNPQEVAHNVQTMAGHIAAGGLPYGASLKFLKRGQTLLEGIDNLNLERVDAPYAVKKVMFDVHTRNTDMMKKAAQAGQTWDDATKVADELAESFGMSTGKLVRALKKKTDNLDAYVLAGRDVINKSASDIHDAMKLAANPNISPEDTQALVKRVQDMWTLHAELQSEILGSGSKIGRALNIHRKMSEPDSRFGYVLNTLKDKAFTEDMIKSLAQMESTDIKGLNRLIASSVNPNFGDYFWGYYYNSILSAPPTHLINTLSNTLWGAFQQFAIRPGRALIDAPIAKLQGREQEYFLREIVPAYVAGLKGFSTGIRKGWEILRHGLNSEAVRMSREFLDGGKLQNPKSIKFAKLAPFTYSPNKYLRAIAPVVEMPTRFLSASDMFFKTIAFESEQYAWATRKAIKESKNLGSQKGFERLAGRIEEIVSEAKPEMIERAAKFAEKSTYTDEPGPFVSYLLRGRNIPFIGQGMRLLMPFISTPANLLKRGLEMTPGLGFVTKSMDIGATHGKEAGEFFRGAKQIFTTEELSDLLMHQLFGGMLGLYMFNKYRTGEVTGDAPTNPAEKSLFYKEKLPWSIKIGDTWYQYRRLEPFNTVMAAAAELAKATEENPDRDNAARAADFAIGMGKNLLDASYLAQMSDLITAFDRSTKGSEQILQNMISRTASGFVPLAGMQRTVSRAMEGEESGGAFLRDPQSAADYLKMNMPYLAESVPKRLDEFGRPIQIPGGAVRQSFPFKYKEPVTDPLDKAIVEAGFEASKPQKFITDRGERLYMEESMYRRFLQEFGKEAAERILKEVERPTYKKLSKEKKAERLKKHYNRVKDKHRREIKKELKVLNK